MTTKRVKKEPLSMAASTDLNKMVAAATVVDDTWQSDSPPSASSAPQMNFEDAQRTMRTVKRRYWSNDETNRLRAAYSQHNGRWSAMASDPKFGFCDLDDAGLPNRTASDLKDRWRTINRVWRSPNTPFPAKYIENEAMKVDRHGSDCNHYLVVPVAEYMSCQWFPEWVLRKSPFFQALFEDYQHFKKHGVHLDGNKSREEARLKALLTPPTPKQSVQKRQRYIDENDESGEYLEESETYDTDHPAPLNAYGESNGTHGYLQDWPMEEKLSVQNNRHPLKTEMRDKSMIPDDEITTLQKGIKKPVRSRVTKQIETESQLEDSLSAVAIQSKPVAAAPTSPSGGKRTALSPATLPPNPMIKTEGQKNAASVRPLGASPMTVSPRRQRLPSLPSSSSPSASIKSAPESITSSAPHSMVGGATKSPIKPSPTSTPSPATKRHAVFPVSKSAVSQKKTPTPVAMTEATSKATPLARKSLSPEGKNFQLRCSMKEFATHRVLYAELRRSYDDALLAQTTLFKVDVTMLEQQGFDVGQILQGIPILKDGYQQLYGGGVLREIAKRKIPQLSGELSGNNHTWVFFNKIEYAMEETKQLPHVLLKAILIHGCLDVFAADTRAAFYLDVADKNEVMGLSALGFEHYALKTYMVKIWNNDMQPNIAALDKLLPGVSLTITMFAD